MDKAKRELLMNICLISPVLSVLYGIMVTGIDNSLVSETSYISGPGGFVVFVLFLLICTLCISCLVFFNLLSSDLPGNRW
ncbi:hypothetical protein GC101_05180 [Paenibacillus sp. LMG 31459]|uniref:Uncharacterized protein n=1 Tax=Paenibacillus phytohabitans TaxID=2654978 RepID=A0ABX1YCL6_9BACL|nr:hypothetical protein [Paenibacillus phytohabitans]NOU78269.1 hypothetical protein [Paenibacillus phytohabitans]